MMTHHHWWALLFRNLWQLQCWPQPRCKNKNKCLASASSLSSRFWRAILLSISRRFSTWEYKLVSLNSFYHLLRSHLFSPSCVISDLHMLSRSASTVSGQARSQECCWRSTTRNCSTCSRILPVFRQRYCVYCCFYHTRVISKYEKRNVLFVGGWSCDCTASPSNENWSLQEIGWENLPQSYLS